MAEIALNAQYSPNRGKVFPCSAEDYDRLVREPWLAQAIDKIREGDESVMGIYRLSGSINLIRGKK